MTKFETPAYIRLTNSADDVIVFGKSPETEASDLVNGIARFGGAWRTPSYILAYMKSASILITYGVHEQCLDDIALPSFYMQRHALELFLKRLLSWLYELAELRVKLGYDNQPVLSKGQINRFKRCHNLESLLNDLCSTSASFGFGKPPPEINNLVNQLRRFEMSETWSRYESEEQKDGSVIHHVNDEVVLSIVAMQSNLEALYSKIAYRLEDDTTYENVLYYAWLSAARSAGEVG